MKKLLVVFLLGLTVSAHAWEKGKNPDRVPSIGVDLWKGQLAGMDRQQGQTNGGTVGFMADYRMPISNVVTIHAGGETESVNNNLKYTDGYRLTVGMRVYIQD